MDLLEKMLKLRVEKKQQTCTAIERRKCIRNPVIRSSQTSLTSIQWDLELLPAIALNRLGNDIDALNAQSVEQNLFFTTPVVKAAWPRLTSLLAMGGCWMLCLWETIGEQRHLRLFMPVRLQKEGLPAKLCIEPLANEYMPLGIPLIHRDCMDEASETLLRLMGNPTLGIPIVLHLTYQYEHSKCLTALKQAATRLGLPFATSHHYKRAALTSAAKGQMPPSGKRRRELKRQKRLLENNGSLKFNVARETSKILDAFESFITLELKSWKGRKGSALYNHKKIASFSRQIVTELALENACEIHTISQTIKKNGGSEEKMVAALIMLGGNGQVMPWKMAFDEKQKSASPGMQIMAHASQCLLQDPAFKQADSLATQDHWMMNHLWPKRLSIVHVAIGLNSNSQDKLDQFVTAVKRKQRLKRFVKRVLRR